MAVLEWMASEDAAAIWARNGNMSLVEGTVEGNAPEVIQELWATVGDAAAALPWIENELPPGVGEDKVYSGSVALITGDMTPEAVRAVDPGGAGGERDVGRLSAIGCRLLAVGHWLTVRQCPSPCAQGEGLGVRVSMAIETIPATENWSRPHRCAPRDDCPWAPEWLLAIPFLAPALIFYAIFLLVPLAGHAGAQCH